MPDDQKSPTDLLGLAPYGKAIKVATEKSLDAVFGGIKMIFGPAADEIGGLLQDSVKFYRYNNTKKMAEKFNLKYRPDGIIHPKTGVNILEFASWSEEDEIADLWAGLLASSCSTDGKDDSNLMFTYTLQKLSIIQVKIISHVCGIRTVKMGKNGLLYCSVSAPEATFSIEDLIKFSGTSDIQRLDRELDHLRSMELITDGFSNGSEKLEAQITPTGLCLHFYARANGHKGDPCTFYKNLLKD